MAKCGRLVCPLCSEKYSNYGSAVNHLNNKHIGKWVAVSTDGDRLIVYRNDDK